MISGQSRRLEDLFQSRGSDHIKAAVILIVLLDRILLEG